MSAPYRNVFVFAVALAAALTSMTSTNASAQNPQCPRCTTFGEAPDALPGLVDVPVAVLRPALGGAIVASGGFGFSMNEPWNDTERYRVSSSLAGALHVLDWLAIGLRVDGRWDQINRGNGAAADTGLIGIPSLTLRATTEPIQGLGLALDASVWMYGADAPSLEPASTSMRARAVGSYHFAIDDVHIAISATVGGLLDNSRAAAPRSFTDRLSDEDRLSLEVSDFSGILAGLGGAVRVGIAEAFTEVTYRALLGDGAPSPGASPLHLRAGARLRPIDELLEVGLLADVLLSEANPAFAMTGGPSAPIEPRFALLLTMGVRLGWETTSPGPDDVTDDVPSEEDPEEPTTSQGRARGRVVEESSTPIEGASVEVIPTTGDTTPRQTNTDADGRWSIDGLPLGQARVILRVEGRDPIETTIDVTADETPEIATTFAAQLPRGEIRGTIQGSDGRPLAGAEIRIHPGGLTLTTDEEGAFETEVPPGSYDVEVRASRHRTQTRHVEVVERGVVFLNAQLHRGR